MEIVVRELKSKDLKLLLKMFSQLKPQSRTDLINVLSGIPKERSEENLMALGVSIFHVLSELTDDLYAWLSDMAGIKPEDLDEMSISTPIDIAKQISRKKEIKDFFGLASQQAEEIL